MRRLVSMLVLAAGATVLAGAAGCTAVPRIMYEPQYHNPFPQLARVAVLPFFNQSTNPTVNGLLVAEAYRGELQRIPGFEVLPVGVVDRYLADAGIRLDHTTNFQQLAQTLGVDAVVVGSVTELYEYYPPRMGLAVNWFAANPSFHPIPPGYGLPWGTEQEEWIPDTLVRDAEFALARQQLATQTPDIPPMPLQDTDRSGTSTIRRVSGTDAGGGQDAPNALELNGGAAARPISEHGPGSLGLPDDWPDPRGFVPKSPSRERPAPNPQPYPVMELVRQYQGSDSEFTERLASYYEFRDDARAGGWQSYLQRKDDFIRFCCYMHITELLAARGGADESRVVWRWNIDRYER